MLFPPWLLNISVTLPLGWMSTLLTPPKAMHWNQANVWELETNLLKCMDWQQQWTFFFFFWKQNKYQQQCCKRTKIKASSVYMFVVLWQWVSTVMEEQGEWRNDCWNKYWGGSVSKLEVILASTLGQHWSCAIVGETVKTIYHINNKSGQIYLISFPWLKYVWAPFSKAASVAATSRLGIDSVFVCICVYVCIYFIFLWAFALMRVCCEKGKSIIGVSNGDY